MKKTFLTILVLAVICSCGAGEPADQEMAVDVKVAKAVSAGVEIAVQAPGTIFGREEASLSSRLTAPIVKLFVRKGDTVEKSQVLAQLEKRDLEAQREEAAAAVADAKAFLERTTAGTLPADIERARGSLRSADAALKQARQICERRTQLFEQGAIPQRDVLVSQTDLAKAESDYGVAEKSLSLLEGKSREADIQMASSRLEQAGARLTMVETQIGYSEIRSPFAGTVTEQFVFPGDMAKPDVPLFIIVDLSVAVARAQVPEAEAAKVRTGQSCRFSPGEDSAGFFEGHVTVVNQAVDPARRSVEAWCEIPNPNRSLRSGSFGWLHIITGQVPDSVVIPLAAVQFREGTRSGSVMVVDSNGAAAEKDVEIGEKMGVTVQVTHGISAGETVIVEGGYGLPSGTRVRVQEGESK